MLFVPVTQSKEPDLPGIPHRWQRSPRAPGAAATCQTPHVSDEFGLHLPDHQNQRIQSHAVGAGLRPGAQRRAQSQAPCPVQQLGATHAWPTRGDKRHHGRRQGFRCAAGGQRESYEFKAISHARQLYCGAARAGRARGASILAEIEPSRNVSDLFSILSAPRRQSCRDGAPPSLLVSRSHRRPKQDVSEPHQVSLTRRRWTFASRHH